VTVWYPSGGFLGMATNIPPAQLPHTFWDQIWFQARGEIVCPGRSF
jgi:hypothetical protein